MVRIYSQIYFVLTSIAGIFMGMNFVLFFFCVYVLWGRESKFRRLLLFSSIVQISLSLAQTALYISYLILAFTLPAGGAEIFFQQVSKYSLPCYIIYALNYAIEGLLLIWRIYVVYNFNIKICIPSIILLLFQVGLSGVTAKGFATEAIITGHLHAFNLATWALIAAVNISATMLICLRLWDAHQRTHILRLSKYKSTIVVVVECGALVTICTVAMLILYAVKRPIGLAGLGFTTQVATLAPLLIIARYGILSREDDRRSLASRMPLRISVARTQDTHLDPPGVEPTGKRRLVPDTSPEHVDGHKPRPFNDIYEASFPGGT